MIIHITIIGMYVDEFNLSPPSACEGQDYYFFLYSMRLRMPLAIQLKEITIKAIRHPNFTSTTKQNAYKAIRLSAIQTMVVISFAFLCFTVYIPPKSLYQPFIAVRHEADITGESVQNSAILQRTNYSFFPIVGIFVPHCKIELISITEI